VLWPLVRGLTLCLLFRGVKGWVGFVAEVWRIAHSAQKPRYRFGPPRGKTAPHYKGTKAASDYPFGKRLEYVASFFYRQKPSEM
jgi:hypothetical protein